MVTVGVVVPYFQKKPGILRRALTSILEQRLPAETRVDIFVVDDGSVAAVAPEIEGLSFRPPFGLKIVCQPNGGCAAARNSGLRETSEGTDYIAFLDSDDFWKTDHIARAVEALDRGFDLYFTDHGRIGHHASHFAEIMFPCAAAPEGTFKKIGGGLWEVERTFFFRYFLRVFTAQISGVVYRRAVYPDARFEDALRTAGEDYVFMLQIVMRASSICFTPDNMVTCGDGVNIYNGNYGWDTEGHLLRVLGDILCIYKLQSALKLSGDDAAYAVRKMTLCRRRFAFFVLRRLIKYRVLWSAELKEMARADPDLWRWLPLCGVYVALLFPLRLYSPVANI
jgi:succinoglycan biosynthesis protein ExoW